MFQNLFFLVLVIIGFYASCGTKLSQSSRPEGAKSFDRPQEQADQEIFNLYDEQLKSLAEMSGSNLAELAGIYLEDSKLRLENIQVIENENSKSNPAFRDYLKNRYIPEIEKILEERGISPDRKAYSALRQSEMNRIAQVTERLIDALENSRESYLLNIAFQLIAFSRSETLGDGRIGSKWNPGSVDAIQGSAIQGLLWVLGEIENKNAADKVSLDELLKWHKALLGSASHSFSQGGQINNIILKDPEGRDEQISVRVERWLEKVNNSQGTLLDAFNLYTEFLHLHPFGDSNGRIAEVAKALVLSKSKSLPLITREKTAVENFLFQKMNGQGLIETEVVNQAIESLAVFDELTQAIGSDDLRSVDLIGANVVFGLQKGSKQRLLVMNRTYYFDPETVGLPPVRGTPVILNEPNARDSYRLRYTSDYFSTAKDIKPLRIIHTQRLGRMKMVYPIFNIELSPESSAKELVFQFLYNHPVSGEVFFHNNGLNYSIPNPNQLSIQDKTNN